VRVINLADRRGPAQIVERVGQQHLAVQPIEDGIRLKEEHPRVTQHEGRGLDALLDAANRGAMRRGIVLHLLAHREVVVAHRPLRGVADPMTPAKRGQRGIRDRDVLRDQFLVHADQIAAALREQLHNLVAVGLRLLSALKLRHRRGAGLEDRPDRPPRNLQGASDLANPLTLRL
jgi:hypothetical protein